jgi:hypothetical protein
MWDPALAGLAKADSASGRRTDLFIYRASVLRELARHGVCPTPQTRPELVRDYVRDLYKYEIRQLKARMLREEFPRLEYSSRVDQLRRQYPVLALLPRQFVE